MTGLNPLERETTTPTDDIAEILFEIVSEHCTDDVLETIKHRLDFLKSTGTLRNQPVAKIWAAALREAVEYRSPR